VHVTAAPDDYLAAERHPDRAQATKLNDNDVNQLAGVKMDSSSTELRAPAAPAPRFVRGRPAARGCAPWR
jgi:hypothetical protein